MNAWSTSPRFLRQADDALADRGNADGAVAALHEAEHFLALRRQRFEGGPQDRVEGNPLILNTLDDLCRQDDPIASQVQKGCLVGRFTLQNGRLFEPQTSQPTTEKKRLHLQVAL